MTWLGRWWRRRKRAMDLKMLWTVCKQDAPDLETARVAFRVHMELDEATYGDMTEREKDDYVSKLT